jgi:hypothetical protein
MQKQHTNQHKNFGKNNVIQVRRDGPTGSWADWTKPCTQKLAVEFALKAERLFGQENVRWVKQ